jgi:hypothetical protein
MKPGDLVRITQENLMHAGKIALVTGTSSAPWYETAGPRKDAIYFEILLEEKSIRGVGAWWLETINEAG